MASLIEELAVADSGAVLDRSEQKLRQELLASERELARVDLTTWNRLYRQLDGKPLEDFSIMHGIQDDVHDRICYKKSAQVFISEHLVNCAFWVADNKIGGRGNVIYAYPTQNKLNEFSRGRVEKAIEESEYLQSRTTNVNNVTMKKVGGAYIYFRGADRRRSLITVDGDLVILDEYDEMMPGVLSIAEKRLGSSLLRWMRVASTPTFPQIGIDALFEISTQAWYFIPCNHCGTKQPLIWNQVDYERIAYICEHCHMPLNRFAEGEWVEMRPGQRWHGYYINKLYSPRADLETMIDASQTTNETELQEFYNSDLGLAYSPRGINISVADLDACIDPEYDNMEESNTVGFCYMGVDVGLVKHVDIVEIWPDGGERLRYSSDHSSFNELDALMVKYNVKRAVVDAGPEIEPPREFASRFRGRVVLCRYQENYKYLPADNPMARVKAHGDRPIDVETADIIHVNRTETLDYTFSRIRDRALRLPYNARVIGGRNPRLRDRFGTFYMHMMAQNRINYVDSHGNTKAKYDEAGKPDHHAHALNYAYVASKEEWFRPAWRKLRFLSLGQKFEEQEQD